MRDVDEMTNAGFKALAARLCVGHAHAAPAKWGCEVEVFGTKIVPDQLIHADKHGFIVIPEEDQSQLLEAARFMDQTECATLIASSRESAGKATDENLSALSDASQAFSRASNEKFGRSGER